MSEQFKPPIVYHVEDYDFTQKQVQAVVARLGGQVIRTDDTVESALAYINSGLPPELTHAIVDGVLKDGPSSPVIDALNLARITKKLSYAVIGLASEPLANVDQSILKFGTSSAVTELFAVFQTAEPTP